MPLTLHRLLKAEKAGPWVTRFGELALPLTISSTWESGHGTWLGYHTRADPVGMGAGELPPATPSCAMGWQGATGSKADLRGMKMEELACPSPSEAIQRAGPAPRLGKIVELALVV